MNYFILVNDELICQDVEILPQELEDLYREIRSKYVIKYYRSDWADDDRDSGMGYCYSNSYTIYREPQRRELVISDGNLVGFYVGYSDDIRIENKPTKKFFLKLEDHAEIYYSGTYSRFYDDSETWELIIVGNPTPFEYASLLWVRNENPNHNFIPADFDDQLVEDVCNWDKYEDNYGHFDNAYRVKVKLTAEGVKDPDLVLQRLKALRPVIVQK